MLASYVQVVFVSASQQSLQLYARAPMDGQRQPVLSQELTCPVVIVRLHHSYSQLHRDHTDVGVERNLQCHFEKKSYQHHVVFEKRQPFLRIWAVKFAICKGVK